MESEMPWPFYKRELYLCSSTTFINSDRKGVVIMLRSTNLERMNLWGFDIPKENPYRAVRADMVKGIMFLEYIDDNSCMLSGMVNINPKF